jgi:hypothetical protein
LKALTLLLIVALSHTQQNQSQDVKPPLDCRELTANGTPLAQDETIVDGKACRPLKPEQAVQLPPTDNKPADAQPAAQSQPVTTTSDAPRGFLLEDGTPVHLILSENVSSADAVTGQTVEFEVVDEVVVNGFIVIPRSSTAWATVTDAEHKRRMGRAGHVDMNIDKVRLADGEKALLRAVKQSQGGSNTGKMVGAMAATAIFTLGGSALFLLVHGKDTIIPKGTAVTAFVAGNVTLDQAKFQRQPVLAQ